MLAEFYDSFSTLAAKSPQQVGIVLRDPGVGLPQLCDLAVGMQHRGMVTAAECGADLG
jgi:hypothetical protein